MATGFDPLHLAEIFGISEQAAIRYAVSARQLSGTAYQAPAPGTPATPGSLRENRRSVSSSSRRRRTRGRGRGSAIADNGRTGPRPVDWDRA